MQAQILDLLADVKESLGLTMVFISHNLAVVQRVSDEVVVLYQGEVVESGPVEQIYADPQHWYTRRLLDADPGSARFSLTPDPSRKVPPVTARLPTTPSAPGALRLVGATLVDGTGAAPFARRRGGVAGRRGRVRRTAARSGTGVPSPT